MKFQVVKAGSEKKTVYGLEAYKEICATIRCKIPKKSMKHIDAAQIRTYLWILPDEERKEFVALAKEVEENLPEEEKKAASIASSSGAAAGAAAKTKKDEKADDKSIGFKRALSLLS